MTQLTESVSTQVDSLVAALKDLRSAYLRVHGRQASPSTIESLRDGYDTVEALVTQDLDATIYSLRRSCLRDVTHVGRANFLSNIELSPFWAEELRILAEVFPPNEVARILAKSRQRLSLACKRRANSSHPIAGSNPVTELFNRLRTRGLAMYLERPDRVSRRERAHFDGIRNQDLETIEAALVFMLNVQAEKKMVLGISYSMAAGLVA